MIFNNSRVYDILKWIFNVALPAAGGLYCILAEGWGFPYAEQVGYTVAALTAFANTLLGISSIKYKNMIDGAREGKITVLNVIDEDEDEEDGN